MEEQDIRSVLAKLDKEDCLKLVFEHKGTEGVHKLYSLVLSGHLQVDKEDLERLEDLTFEPKWGTNDRTFTVRLGVHFNLEDVYETLRAHLESAYAADPEEVQA